MKLFLLFPLIISQALSNFSIAHFSLNIQDSTTIAHSLDGKTDEWPDAKFQSDNTTKIRYAVDNDKQTLFIALIISDNTAQRKVVQGMNLYIDTKGKKKENHGVEFPLTSNPGFMRLFGFGEAEPFAQSILSEGTINIAFTWDDSNVLRFEYHIPLKMLENTVSELNNRKISIGWKLNESETNGNAQPLTTTSRIVGVPSTEQSNNAPTSARTRRTAAAANPGTSSFPQSTSNKSTSFWTSHTIEF